MRFHCAPRAFTLIEMLLAIVVAAIAIAMLAPVTTRVLAEARSARCANHLRVIGSAALLYAADHDMTLPVTVHQRRSGMKSWTITLQEYASGTVAFRCPDDGNTERPYSYVVNDFLTPHPAGAPWLDFSRLNGLDSPAETFLFGEAAESYTNSDHFHFTDYTSDSLTGLSGGGSIPPEVFKDQVAVERHHGKAHYVFADGHAETLGWDYVRSLLLNAGSRFVDPTAEKTNQQNDTPPL